MYGIVLGFSTWPIQPRYGFKIQMKYGVRGYPAVMGQVVTPISTTSADPNFGVRYKSNYHLLIDALVGWFKLGIR